MHSTCPLSSIMPDMDQRCQNVATERRDISRSEPECLTVWTLETTKKEVKVENEGGEEEGQRKYKENVTKKKKEGRKMMRHRGMGRTT